MRSRTLPAEAYADLKAATRAMVKEGFGTQGRAAAVTRVGQGQISDYGSGAPDQAEIFMPVDVLADLMTESGNLTVLRSLGDLVDCLVVPLPGGACVGLVAERTGRSAKEFGDVMSRIGEALRDGRISEREAAEICTEIRECMLELSGLAKAVQAASRRERDR